MQWQPLWAAAASAPPAPLSRKRTASKLLAAQSCMPANQQALGAALACILQLVAVPHACLLAPTLQITYDGSRAKYDIPAGCDVCSAAAACCWPWCCCCGSWPIGEASETPSTDRRAVSARAVSPVSPLSPPLSGDLPPAGICREVQQAAIVNTHIWLWYRVTPQQAALHVSRSQRGTATCWHSG